MPVNRIDPPPAGSARGPDHDDDDAQRGGPEAVERLHRQAEELGEYVRHYLAARGDSIRAVLRKFGLWLVAAIVGLTVLVAMLSTAAVIATLGVAQLAGQALGDRPWAGYLVTGFGLLAIAAVVLFTAIVILRRRFRKDTVEKYARRHRQQKARFGHDVAEQAEAVQSQRG
jgi:hypothetical protein